MRKQRQSRYKDLRKPWESFCFTKKLQACNAKQVLVRASGSGAVYSSTRLVIAPFQQQCLDMLAVYLADFWILIKLIYRSNYLTLKQVLSLAWYQHDSFCPSRALTGLQSKRCPSRFKCTCAALTLTCIGAGAVITADAQGYVLVKTQDMGWHNQHCSNRTADFSQVDTTLWLWLWMTTAITV